MSALSRAVAAARWLGGRRVLLPLTARLLCARTVRESVRFFAAELVRPRGIRDYTLRESGMRVAVRHRSGDAATVAEVFYRHDYRPPQLLAARLGSVRSILDLGANIGLFGAFAAPLWPDARIVGYEPDPDNARVHERTIALNGLQDRWRVVQAAAGARDGHAQLAVGLAMASHIAAEGERVQGEQMRVPVRDVLPAIADADLVKLDIEGAEWELLLDPRFAASPPRVMVLEYHPEMCPQEDPRTAVDAALAAAGLRSAPIWVREDGYGMLWAWREPASS